MASALSSLLDYLVGEAIELCVNVLHWPLEDALFSPENPCVKRAGFGEKASSKRCMIPGFVSSKAVPVEAYRTMAVRVRAAPQGGRESPLGQNPPRTASRWGASHRSSRAERTSLAGQSR